MRKRQPGLWESEPEDGSLGHDDIELLLPVLRAHTQTSERCWFAFWDGWGIPIALTPEGGAGEVPDTDTGAETARNRHRAPRFSIPGRDLLLFRGSLDAAFEGFYGDDEWRFQSAYFWWPDDRAWCVVTEIDLMSTHIGGSQDCVAALLQTPGIEALHAAIGHRITWASDTINPNPFRE